MVGPCLCGDPYCSSCGDPSQAAYGDWLEDLSNKIDDVKPTEDEAKVIDFMVCTTLEYIKTTRLKTKA